MLLKNDTKPGELITLLKNCFSLQKSKKPVAGGGAGGGARWPLIPALGRQGQGNLCEFEAGLMYTAPGKPGLCRETLS